MTKFSINKAVLAGNVGADPDARFTGDGVAITTVRLATSKSYRDEGGKWQEQTEWHTVKFFGKQGEYAASKIQKGTGIYVEGEIHTRKWQDKDGHDRYSTEIRADTLKIIDKAKPSGAAGNDKPATPERAPGGNDDWQFGGNDIPY